MGFVLISGTIFYPIRRQKDAWKNVLYACATSRFAVFARQMTPGSLRIEISLQSSTYAYYKPVFSRPKNCEMTP